MSASPTLAKAAGAAFDNLQIRWSTNGMKLALTNFFQTSIDLFPESEDDSHPVSNWIIVMAALASRMPALNVPIEQLTAAAEIVYRLCWMAQYLQTVGTITTGQANSLLANYNTFIAF